jgi:type II secretory pathway component PulF
MEIVQTNIPDIPAWKSVFKADVPSSTLQSITDFVQKHWVWFTGGAIIIVVFIVIALSNQSKPKEKKEETLPPPTPISDNPQNPFRNV